MKKILVIVAVGTFLSISGVFLFWFQGRLDSETIARFENGAEIIVEIADEAEEQSRGLSGRTELASNRGMLFIFNESVTQRFWMRDMLFPIDIIWLNSGTIIGFEENVNPPIVDGILEIYESPGPVDMVMEVNAGFIKSVGLVIGGRVVWKR